MHGIITKGINMALNLDRGALKMDLIEGIMTRRSIRQYTDEKVEMETLKKVIISGTWAPSGLNNQPWRFVPVTNREVMDALAEMTKYERILKDAPACIGVFLDHDSTYHETKDHQAIGACIQNMLLTVHAMGLGAVWLGEILKNADKVLELFGLPETLELMAVVAIRPPSGPPREPTRHPIEKVIVKEIT